MALINRTDPDTARQALARWLSARIPDSRDLEVSSLDAPTGSGLSNEIFTFDATWTTDDGPTTTPMVVRVAPIGEGLFPAYDLPAEGRLMRTLAKQTAVPVPPIIGTETDESVLGASFLVMQRVSGRVPSDDPPFTVEGWVCGLTTAQRARLYDNALQRLADIHNVDWRALGLDFLDQPQWGRQGIEQQVGYLEHLAAWTLKGRANPTIERTLAWVREHQPHDEPLVLNWGDARPGNMMFDDDLSVRAVLDWEMASIASPELDMGLWLFLQRHHTEGIGAPLPDGFLNHADMAARYAELTDHTPRHLDYYETLAGLRAAIVMVRFADLMIAAGILPPDSDMQLSNPAARLLAEMRGFPAPTGAGKSYIGQRN